MGIMEAFSDPMVWLLLLMMPMSALLHLALFLWWCRHFVR
jgi:hypothetical protein